MSIIKRLKRVTVGAVEKFLNTVEDPEIVFPELIKEMEEQIRAAVDAEAKSLAAVKAAERSLEKAKEKEDKMMTGAESALRQENEALAREAIEAQVDIEDNIARCEKALSAAKIVYDDARAARFEAEGQLNELRNKKDEIITRARVAKSQDKIQQTAKSAVGSSSSILDAVTRLESQVEEKEAELEVRKDFSDGGSTPDLERRIDDMNKSSEVDERLAALKAKINK